MDTKECVDSYVWRVGAGDLNQLEGDDSGIKVQYLVVAPTPGRASELVQANLAHGELDHQVISVAMVDFMVLVDPKTVVAADTYVAWHGKEDE